MTKELYEVSYTADIIFRYKKEKYHETVILSEFKTDYESENLNNRYKYLSANEVTENEKQIFIIHGSMLIRKFAMIHRKQFDYFSSTFFEKEKFVISTRYCINKFKERYITIPLKDVKEIKVYRHYQKVSHPKTIKLLNDLDWNEFCDYAYDCFCDKLQIDIKEAVKGINTFNSIMATPIISKAAATEINNFVANNIETGSIIMPCESNSEIKEEE